MTTTFITRKTARDALITLFTSNNNWQKVFGYLPTEDEIKAQSPLLIIVSNGTRQEMSGVNFNKSDYSFVCTTWVKMSDIELGGTFGHDDAEDKLDALDREFRQVIRNTVALDSGKAHINFSDGQSNTNTVEAEYGQLYRVETYMITVSYPAGQ